jgi:hypothetical protein
MGASGVVAWGALPALQCSAVVHCVAWAMLSYPLACCCVRVAGGGQPTGATWMKEGFAMRLLHFSFFSFPSLPFCPPSTCNKASQILPQQIPPTPISTHLLTFFVLQTASHAALIVFSYKYVLASSYVPQQIATRTTNTIQHITSRAKPKCYVYIYRNCEFSLPHFEL